MGPATRDDPVIVWRPQAGPQHAFVKCPYFDCLFGGARGGGKSDACLGEFALHASHYGPGARGLFVRREMPQADSLIDRSHEIYAPLGAEWGEQKKQWVFPNGAVLRFRPLEGDRDAEKYQGQQFSRVYVEELTNYPEPRPVDKMKATLRSAGGVPVKFRATANPGGPGHNWVKQRYIDPHPLGYQAFNDESGQRNRIYIPARVHDNRRLLMSDPGYVERLKLSGSATLVKAWLDGDWSVIEGAYFDCWSNERHVIAPFEIPKLWTRFRAMDWGSAAPFAVYWVAVVSDPHDIGGRLLPRGSLVVYREWYGATGPNVGLKLTAEAVGRGIVEREAGDKVDYGVLDPAAFAQDGGPSIAERLANAGAVFRPADNRRAGTLGHSGGWDQLRQRLVGDEDGKPMLYVFGTCKDLIRTLPVLQHDQNRPEDVDTDGEDHAADALRYGVMSRPWTRPAPQKPRPITKLSDVTLDQLYAAHERGNRKGRI